MFNFLKLTFTSFLLLLASSVNATELITNGDFESGDIVGWSCTGFSLCQADVDAVVTGTYGLKGYANTGFATLSQTISTVSGVNYDFSFYSFVSNIVPANILRYQVDGGAIVTVSSTAIANLTTDSFIATGATSVIDFFFETDIGTGFWGIDDISVQDTASGVSVPAPLLLLSVGLFGLGFARKRLS